MALPPPPVDESKVRWPFWVDTWTLGHLDRWVDERKRTNPSLASKSRFSSTKVGSYLFQTVHKLAPNIFNNLSKIIPGFVLQSYSEFFS